MSGRLLRVVLLIVAACWCTHAEAGLIRFDSDFARSCSGSSSASASESQAAPAEQPRPVDVADWWLELVGVHTAPAAPQNMSGGNVSSAGPVATGIAVTVVTPKSSASAGPTSRLLYESRIVLPVPFLDGIFRPPRV